MCCILVPCALPVLVCLQLRWSCPHIVPLTLSTPWMVQCRKAGLFSWTLYLWYTGLFRRLAVSKASDMGTLFFITLFSSSDSWLPDILASPCHRPGTAQTLSPAAIQVTPSRCWNAERLLWRVQSKEQQRHTLEATNAVCVSGWQRNPTNDWLNFIKLENQNLSKGLYQQCSNWELKNEAFSWDQVAKQKLQPQLPEKVFRMQRKLHK